MAFGFDILVRNSAVKTKIQLELLSPGSDDFHG